MKKWIALALALVMLTLCGCDALDIGQEETTAPAPMATTAPVETTTPEMEMVELSLWVVSEGIWADAGAVEALLTEFNDYYPNIAVNVAWKSADEIGGDKPDIVLADAAQIAGWSAQGGMADLSEFWANGLKDDVYPEVAVLCGTGEQYHTVPMCVIPYCMAVNQAVFEDADALQYLNTVNHTWHTSSFLSAVQAVFDVGTDTVGTIFCKDTREDVFTRLLVSNLYDGSFVDRKSGTYTVTSDPMLKALTALAEQDGIVIDPAVDADGARERFLNGETALVLNWNAALQLKNAANQNILFMAYPSSDSRPETYADAHGFGIFDQGDAVRLAASKTFVTYMSGNAGAIQATGNLPARKSAASVYAGTGLEAVMKDLAKLLDYLTEPEATADHWETARNEWNTMLRNIDAWQDVPVEEGVEPETTWQDAVFSAQENLNALFPHLFPAEDSEVTE